MSTLKVSDSAYEEFKKLLDDNNISDYVIRINVAGMSCHGPAFNIVVDTEKEDDVVEKVKDITFLMNKSLIEDFEGFIISSSEENGVGLQLEPIKDLGISGGCSGCSGGCGE